MSGNRTVKRCIEILEFISKRSDGATLKEIINQLKIPKTSGYDILKELVDNGMLVQKKGELNTYRIGLRAFQIGNEYLNETDLISTSKPIVRTMAESLNKTAFIAVLSEGYVTYIYKYEPKKSIITTSNIGTKNPIHCTSLGKAILSGMSFEEQTYELSFSNYEKRTVHTITSKKELLEDLKLAQKKGYAIDNREIEDHTLCIGSPIYNHEGHVIAGLSVSGLYSKNRDIVSEGEIIKSAAQDISRNLGYRG